MRILFVFLLVSLLNVLSATAQEKEIPVPLKTDTVPPVKQKLSGSSRYDSAMKAHSPRTAAIRSAMLPGLDRYTIKNTGNCPLSMVPWVPVAVFFCIT